MLEFLNPTQLGFIFESLLINAEEAVCKDDDDKQKALVKDPYLKSADFVRGAIEANCGWDEYISHWQSRCKELAEKAA